ncbi:anti-sigma-K factor RskA [Microbacterium terrae]|uniref:Regulator of SigK n=1 Tax=Microbacterium terrae TaxID=69369 RepID=A0A0M2HD11_9MICO|nr:anti-sigma factor [Microbacterium terrae]KJL42099.1 Anti-sigma-K factor rskA [Microbacterium terrae]MBP1076638.1 anti-sigma-K factor RskA [Microbacterium terrae]GLJ97467.1 hypothetical protein GCM10017594_06640 [Microbacterium terrae]
MNEQEFAELSAGHALHALSPDESAAFERALAEHPEWQSIADADGETVAALAAATTEVAPPLTLRSTLLSTIAILPQGDRDDAGPESSEDAPVEVPDEPDAAAPEPETATDAAPFVEPAPTTSTIQAVERRNWTRGLLALAASVVLLVVLGFGAATVNELVNRTPAQVALAEIESAPDAQSSAAVLTDGGTATVHWSESVGKVVLTSAGLPAIADDEDFELWYVRGDEPISAGTFDAAASGQTVALLDGAMEAGDAIAVTVEPAGGSPTGAPSTEPIVVVPTGPAA